MFAARAGFLAQQESAPANARRTGTSSTNASATYTRSGSPVTSTTQVKFGTASAYSPSANNFISTNNGGFMAFGTGDYCIEWWMYIPSLSGHGASCDLFAANPSPNGGLLGRIAKSYNNSGLSSGDPKYFNIGARQTADHEYWTMSSNWAAGQWYFCVLQRKSNVTAFWRDGVVQTKTGTGSHSYSYPSTTNFTLLSASDGNGAGPIYVDEFCVSNTYRYTDQTASIPVPSSAFSLDSYTVQLLHLDGSNNGTTFTNVTS